MHPQTRRPRCFATSIAARVLNHRQRPPTVNAGVVDDTSFVRCCARGVSFPCFVPRGDGQPAAPSEAANEGRQVGEPGHTRIQLATGTTNAASKDHRKSSTVDAVAAHGQTT